jgi:signal transduction histidine kinase
VPVRVDLDLPCRLPEPIEAAAYFVVCEALANVAKHSQATQAVVEGGMSDGELTVQIQDNGVGGADAAQGSGLAGLADRIAIVGGCMALSSPAGGPTVLRVEIPCCPPPS